MPAKKPPKKGTYTHTQTVALTEEQAEILDELSYWSQIPKARIVRRGIDLVIAELEKRRREEKEREDDAE